MKILSFRTFVQLFVLFFIIFAFSVSVRAAESPWPVAGPESRVWLRWWWLGSAVDNGMLTKLLEEYSAAGVGGVEITPIYGVKGLEARELKYLSPQWMDALAHTEREAERLGMKVDMATGTGWPFGGPNISFDSSAQKISFKSFDAPGGDPLKQGISGGRVVAAAAFDSDGTMIDLSKNISRAGVLEWTPPAGAWKIIAAVMSPTGQMVKRAAPGGEGYVLDHFSAAALKKYLKRFDSAFDASGAPAPRAFFNDSFEVYGADWTPAFMKEFEKRRGYSALAILPDLVGNEDTDRARRARCDYRETISDLLLDEFTVPWTAWAHSRGALTRDQAHGSPGNLLDLYGEADIPETEIFGPGRFPIPGLRVDPDVPDDMIPSDQFVAKFASSAAHTQGKRLASSETATWLGEHFRTALSQAKPELDNLFAAGINHIVLHGSAYSPPDEPWPGRVFYAAVEFSPQNTIWEAFPDFAAYIARVQSFMQSGEPDSDVLLYWPVHDVWHDGIDKRLINQFSVHNAQKWLRDTPFGTVAAALSDEGYSFDYVSDRQLAGARAEGGKIALPGGKYAVLVVPHCRHMPVETLEKIIALARDGTTVIFEAGIPEDAPGLGSHEQKRERLRALNESAAEENFPRLFSDVALDSLLLETGTRREPAANAGLRFIRRRLDGGRIYFFANLGTKAVDEFVALGTPAAAALILDPLTGGYGRARIRQSPGSLPEVMLQLAPGESLLLRTYETEAAAPAAQDWRYLGKIKSNFSIAGPWKIEFIRGGPQLPGSAKMEKLVSWTELNDERAKEFAGTARYTAEFVLPDEPAGDWLLELGDVRESARVSINGRSAGTAWCIPFKLRIGNGMLKRGRNTIEIEVTNLSANRIAAMDRRGEEWKKFKDANVVGINYKPLDAGNWPAQPSGLLGPVVTENFSAE